MFVKSSFKAITINYVGVNVPINLVCAANPVGNRFSLIVGYAIGKTKSRKEV